MRIGELAQRVGVSTDTVRFYERSGLLPRPARQSNSYRDYGERDIEHLRLLIDLRRLDIPLADAAQVASWCHSGHCAETTGALPALLRRRRAEVAERIAGLQSLDSRLAALERHLGARTLTVLGPTACCVAAEAVAGVGQDACACCAPAMP